MCLGLVTVDVVSTQMIVKAGFTGPKDEQSSLLKYFQLLFEVVDIHLFEVFTLTFLLVFSKSRSRAAEGLLFLLQFMVSSPFRISVV